MTQLNEILKIATLGTNRQPYSGDNNPEWQKDFEAKKTVEADLLQRSSLWTYAKRAGYIPQKASKAKENIAPDETLDYVQPKAMYYFKNAETSLLREEFLEEVAQSERIFTPESLPYLFDTAVQQKIPNKLVLQVCGERGKWLAQFHPKWKIFELPKEEHWETGKFEKRLNYFKHIRSIDADKARTLLEATIKEESVDQLKKLLPVLEENLSSKDEALLESLIGHRRKEVRDVVQYLLRKIPESALVNRAKEQLIPLIQFDKKLKITLPTKLTEAMEKDGISDGIKLSGIGKKAARLVQLLQAVPTEFWNEHLKQKTDKLIAAAEKSEYQKALIYGWTTAVTHHPNQEWAEAILTSIAKENERYTEIGRHYTKQLCQMCSPQFINKLIFDKLNKTKELQRNSVSFQLMIDYGKSLEPKIVYKFFALLKKDLSKGKKKTNYNLDQLVYELKNQVHLFPNECLEKIEKSWEDMDTEQYHYKHIQELFIGIDYIEPK